MKPEITLEVTVMAPEGFLHYLGHHTAEISFPSPDCPHPNLWSMKDGASCEEEVLDFLKQLVRLIKPQTILETGTFRGYSANAMAEGCEENGFGVVITCDPDKHFEEGTLHKRVYYHQCPSLDLMISQPIDLLFCDSDVKVRLDEVERFSSLLTNRAIIVIHDTGLGHKQLMEDTKSLMEAGILNGVFLPTPRGLFIGRLSTSHWR